MLSLLSPTKQIFESSKKRKPYKSLLFKFKTNIIFNSQLLFSISSVLMIGVPHFFVVMKLTDFFFVSGLFWQATF